MENEPFFIKQARLLFYPQLATEDAVKCKKQKGKLFTKAAIELLPFQFYSSVKIHFQLSLCCFFIKLLSV
jgi:hypothetical protein